VTANTGDANALAALLTGRVVPRLEIRCAGTGEEAVGCGKLLAVIFDTPSG